MMREERCEIEVFEKPNVNSLLLFIHCSHFYEQCGEWNLRLCSIDIDGFYIVHYCTSVIALPNLRLSGVLDAHQ